MVQEYTNNKYDYMKVRFVGLINQLTIFIKKKAKSLQTLCESVRLNL